jgi:SET domain-containing protein
MIKSFISPKVVIRKSKVHGKGMMAKEKIKRGEIVFIKGGHLLTKAALFSSGVINSYLPLDDNYYLGATNKAEEESIKLFINHSCNPNCGMRGEISFVAMREITEGEELTIDYAMVDNEDYSITCTCASPLCRKKVTGFDWKRKELQSRYEGYFARYLEDKIRMQS